MIWRPNLHQSILLAEAQKPLEAHGGKFLVTTLSIVPHTLGILPANITYCIVLLEYGNESQVIKCVVRPKCKFILYTVHFALQIKASQRGGRCATPPATGLPCWVHVGRQDRPQHQATESSRSPSRSQVHARQLHHPLPRHQNQWWRYSNIAMYSQGYHVTNGGY